MYLLLLMFGVVLTAAGTLLAASGVSIHERVFDATTVTPGVVAAVGGLLLIGLGLALRVLRRIEHALEARPMPRAARRGEAFEPTAATEPPSEPARIPFPPKLHHPQRATGATAAPPKLADERRLGGLTKKFSEKLPAMPPDMTRFESTRGVEEADLSVSQKVPPLEDEVIGEVTTARLGRRRNGATPTRITQRLEVSARAAITSERPKGPEFDSLWPDGPRPMRAAAPVAGPEQDNDSALDAPPPVAPDEVSEVAILKSGVVDGMAYTLYSDGSIKAELPQGTLRFGSITELRSHIQQGS
jgi:hypothetical protein